MSEIPILFTGDMVRAIFADTKDVTRRPVRWPRSARRIGIYSSSPEYVWVDSDGGYAWADDFNRKVDIEVRCPYGKPGDVLWVRETWRRSDSVMHYRASHDKLPSNERWRPSIHMPRWACRLLLRRTDPATIELVFSITEDEARKEGFRDRRAFLDWWARQYSDARYCWRIPFEVIRL